METVVCFVLVCSHSVPFSDDAYAICNSDMFIYVICLSLNFVSLRKFLSIFLLLIDGLLELVFLFSVLLLTKGDILASYLQICFKET